MITEKIEWVGKRVVLIKLNGLARHPSFPYGHNRRNPYVQREHRPIEKVIVHQTAGSFRAGVAAATKLASWITRSPVFNEKGKRVGGGRGFPGAPYTFVIPHHPDLHQGRYVVYRCWDDSWITWHSGSGWNKRSVAVGLSGMLRSRHAPRWSADYGRAPSAQQTDALQDLVEGFLLPRYGLTTADVMGHFDCGKVACPGDDVEIWIRKLRGEHVGWSPFGGSTEMSYEDKALDLSTWRKRQSALVSLGYWIGPSGVDGIPGPITRAAIEAFQSSSGLVVDGVWGRYTEAGVRKALKAK